MAFSARVSGQPPGTFPPPDLLRSPERSSSELPIKGFYLLDESKSRVLVPGMTYERYRELTTEEQRQTRRYIFDQIKIDGRVEGQRAEMVVQIDLSLRSSGDETISIPLQLSNFHRISPPEFLDGIEETDSLAVTVDDQTGDYLLLASVKNDTRVSFRMRMSARVESGTSSSLQFSLPTAPVKISLSSDALEATGEIVNRNDEIVQTRYDKSGRSEFLIESGGGRFTLRWGTVEQSESAPFLEAETKMVMRWNSPSDEPIQNVQLVVRDLRDSISKLQLRLPDDAVLLDAPILATSGRVVEYTSPDPNDGQLLELNIPREEQRQRIDLELDLHVPLDSVEPGRELTVRVPTVVGALRHQGTIDIRTAKEYRLRWREGPYVQNATNVSSDESASETRTYTFRFSRGGFQLPVWMGVTKKQLRVSSRCEFELHDSYVSLELEINSSGTQPGLRIITLDLGDWEAPQIVSALTGAPLTTHESEGRIEIEASIRGVDDNSAPILIRAQKSIAAIDGDGPLPIELAIPRVIGSVDESGPISVQETVVKLVGKGRTSMVVDLASSKHVERTNEAIDEDQRFRFFRVMPPDSRATFEWRDRRGASKVDSKGGRKDQADRTGDRVRRRLGRGITG